MKGRLLLILFFGLFFIPNHYSQGCNCVKIVFIVDNSGSITNTEFSHMENSINLLGSQILQNYENVEIAIVQYATEVDYFTPLTTHLYDVSVPFTDNQSTLINWDRNFGAGTPNPAAYEDHLPGTLYEMRNDGVWSPGGSLDIQTSGCSVRYFIFTDAVKSMPGGCCSVLKNLENAPNALPNYDEYNYLKNTYDSKFVVYHVAVDEDAEEAGAAIASVGGSYNGVIDSNPGDPEGEGTLPRLYHTGGFSLSQELIDEVVANIDPTGDPLDVLMPDTVCQGELVTFESTGSDGFNSISWDFGDGNNAYDQLYAQHEYQEAGTYNIRHTYSNNNCVEDVLKPITVEVCLENKFVLHIPNSFSPNGDGVNDFLEIYFDGIKESELFIFNRWGEQVYHTADLNKFWDGSEENIRSNQSVYIFKVNCTDIYEMPHEIIGHVTLIK